MCEVLERIIELFYDVLAKGEPCHLSYAEVRVSSEWIDVLQSIPKRCVRLSIGCPAPKHIRLV